MFKYLASLRNNLSRRRSGFNNIRELGMSFSRVLEESLRPSIKRNYSELSLIIMSRYRDRRTFK